MATKICDFQHKIGYNLACAGGTSSILARSREFSGPANSIMSVKLFSDDPCCHGNEYFEMWTVNHRLNGSSSPVLTATCLSYGSLCDFLVFSWTDLGVTPIDQFDAKWLRRRARWAFCTKNQKFWYLLLQAPQISKCFKFLDLEIFTRLCL